MNTCVKEVLNSIRLDYSEERYEEIRELIATAHFNEDITTEEGIALLDVIKYWRFYRRIVG